MPTTSSLSLAWLDNCRRSTEQPTANSRQRTRGGSANSRITNTPTKQVELRETAVRIIPSIGGCSAPFLEIPLFLSGVCFSVSRALWVGGHVGLWTSALDQALLGTIPLTACVIRATAPTGFTVLTGRNQLNCRTQVEENCREHAIGYIHHHQQTARDLQVAERRRVRET